MNNEILAIVIYSGSFHILKESDEPGILISSTLRAEKDVKRKLAEMLEFMERPDVISFRSGVCDTTPTFEKDISESHNIFASRKLIENDYIQLYGNSSSSSVKLILRYVHEDHLENIRDVGYSPYIENIKLGKFKSPLVFFEKVLGLDISKEEWLNPVLLKLEINRQ